MITDICLYLSPYKRSIEIYRSVKGQVTLSFREYLNPTRSTTERIKRMAQIKPEHLHKSEDDDGWIHERNWYSDNPHVTIERTWSQQKFYVTLHFREVSA